MVNNIQSLFISHGGGPMPLLGDASHQTLVDGLKMLSHKVNKPDAIIVVSAHWEANIPTITSGLKPKLIYDYSGFPPESYTIQYPCPGEPALATQMQQALAEADIESRLDAERGYDHGVFVPLKIIFPQADIPVVQLSLVRGLNPLQHINLGKALRALAFENLLVIGSGFSFHNMRAFFAPDTADTQAMNLGFEQWLIETCASTKLSENERMQRLIDWDRAPFARYCQPREEHLLPLHVCYGVAQQACSEYLTLEVLNKHASMYLWA